MDVLLGLTKYKLFLFNNVLGIIIIQDFFYETL
jgi:hypothetical protein